MKEAIIQYNDNPDADGGHMVISWKPLVRCKDCWKREFDNCPFNEHLGFRPDDNWYCADGERTAK